MVRLLNAEGKRLGLVPHGLGVAMCELMDDLMWLWAHEEMY